MLKAKVRKNNVTQGSGTGSLSLNNKCEVMIFGQKYTLRSDSDDGYTRQLAEFVDQKMTDLSARTKGVELSKLAIFTAVNIAHELIQLKKEFKETETVISRRTRILIDNIEEQFEEFKPMK
jgi:cell division protein ZapA